MGWRFKVVNLWILRNEALFMKKKKDFWKRWLTHLFLHPSVHLPACPSVFLVLSLSVEILISMQRLQYDLLKVICQIAANWLACNQAQCEYILTCVFPALHWVPKDLWQPGASLNTNKVSTDTVGKVRHTHTNESTVSRMTHQTESPYSYNIVPDSHSKWHCHLWSFTKCVSQQIHNAVSQTCTHTNQRKYD